MPRSIAPTGVSTGWRSALAAVPCAIAAPASAAIPPAESQALVALHEATGGASWTNRTNWVTAIGDECTWFGVTCDAGAAHVIAISLYNNHLDGALPALAGLSQLQTLDLSRNAVTGCAAGLAGLTEFGPPWYATCNGGDAVFVDAFD